jgi:nucleotide-binding universal stress UspA family protein
MKNILCAIDETEHSQAAVDLAANLAVAFGAEVTLLAVNELLGGGRVGSAYLWTDAELAELLEKAKRQAARVGGMQPQTKSIRSRDVARSIVTFAEDNGFDHIVVGSGNRGKVSKFLLGSVSSYVMARAHCPVTVAR